MVKLVDSVVTVHPFVPNSCEGVMKMGYSSGVPRITGHGTCGKGADVVNEVGDDGFNEFLREIGDWPKQLWNVCLRGTFEKLFDFDLATIP